MAQKTSDKRNAQYLAQLLKEHGCHRVVISPGSRNAPLIIALAQDPGYQCYSAPDERAAGFTALGMTLETGEPVAVACTSGSAAANYYPAVVEAFYQKRPLVVLTADRPHELIDQGVGQTIRQQGLFNPHIAHAVNLLREPADAMAASYNQRLINEALHATHRGPVHINVPFDEPLYGRTTAPGHPARFIARPPVAPPEPDLSQLIQSWQGSKKIMLLAGHLDPSPTLAESLQNLQLQSPFLVLSETVSNLPGEQQICSIDRLINTLTESEKEELRPELLLTMGGEVVSKMVKQFITEFPPQQHWHLSETGEMRDTFQRLDGLIHTGLPGFFERMAKLVDQGAPHYRDAWLQQDARRRERQGQFVNEAPFSDWLAFNEILKHLPAGSVLHTANSASIRYAQLFDHAPGTRHYTNRGTSGIDGCTSTAVGHALTTQKPVTLVTGDVAFLYDANAFWQHDLPDNLRVVVLNNAGGNIFRIIQGPDKDAVFERFQETVHQHQLSSVAATYDIEFQSVANLDQLLEVLPGFYSENKGRGPRILEIKTPREKNPRVLKSYFSYLKNAVSKT